MPGRRHSSALECFFYALSRPDRSAGSPRTDSALGRAGCGVIGEPLSRTADDNRSCSWSRRHRCDGTSAGELGAPRPWGPWNRFGPGRRSVRPRLRVTPQERSTQWRKSGLISAGSRSNTSAGTRGLRSPTAPRPGVSRRVVAEPVGSRHHEGARIRGEWSEHPDRPQVQVRIGARRLNVPCVLLIERPVGVPGAPFSHHAGGLYDTRTCSPRRAGPAGETRRGRGRRTGRS